MAKADKYATADSAMWVKVTASDKIVPTPSTPKPAGDNRGGQNNKRKTDQLDSRSTSKQVANMEEDAPATQAGSQRQRAGKNTWQPKLTFEQMLDAPCKMHTGAKPATHTLRQCSFGQRLSQGEGLPAPPAAAAAPRAPAPGPAPAPPPPPHNDAVSTMSTPTKTGLGLCWLAFESKSLDGFKKSRSNVFEGRSLIPVTDRLPTVGLAGRMLERTKELGEKESKGNQKIKMRVSKHSAYEYNAE
ncbi:hypothetical protein D1007_06291 [Hordeum vulgare]|nr:hypothetical protein D1007_06291 [Hordeum vulgare]